MIYFIPNYYFYNIIKIIITIRNIRVPEHCHVSYEILTFSDLKQKNEKNYYLQISDHLRNIIGTWNYKKCIALFDNFKTCNNYLHKIT